MKFEEHCEESIKLFGKPGIGMKHRKFRHHIKGIEEAVILFGSEVEKVAMQHIISDLKMEGWDESYPFPKDMKDYINLGLF